MNKKWIVLLFGLSLLAILIFSFGCQLKPITIGSNNKVLVLADSTLWGHIEQDVRNAVEKEVYTPQLEKIFTIILREPGKFGDLKRFPHLLFIGTLNQKGTTKDILEGMLDETARRKIEQDSSFIFRRRDAWSKGQLLVVLVSKDLETLKGHLQKDKDLIFKLFDDHANEIVMQQMYRLNEQKDIEKQLMQEHGWSVRVQHDFFVAIDSSEARFVWLRRMGPQREFFVYWEPVDDPSKLSKEWMMQKRDSLSKVYFEGDYIFQDSSIKVKSKTIDFNGRYAIQLDGVWQNEKNIVGGPFRSFGFYNKSDGRLYLVDCSIVAPGERKWPYMRQVEAMARTFKTADEVKK